ncbi:MAG: hypothetical protein M4579_001455 [Chaenotheca gracillima]|nr:MAG: hypothetical protein M4579_001455 [Chaenotheca gracillima]
MEPSTDHEVTIFTQHLLKNTEDNVSDSLKNWLDPVSPTTRVLRLCALLNKLTGLFERHVQLVDEAWTYLEQHQLWKYHPHAHTLEDLKTYLSFDETVGKDLRRHSRYQRRRAALCRTIEKNWGKKLEEILRNIQQTPVGEQSAMISRHSLELLAILSARMTYHMACEDLCMAIRERQGEFAARKTQTLLPSDIDRVRAKQLQDPQLQLLGENTAMRPLIDVQTSTTGDAESDSDSTAESQGNVSLVSATFIHDAIGATQPAKGSAADDSLCACPPALKSDRILSSSKLQQIFNTWEENDKAEQLCHIHKRHLCGSLGLRTNVSGSQLDERLNLFRKTYAQDLERMQAARPELFRLSTLPEHFQNKLVLYRYRVGTSSAFEFDATSIFNRFLGADAWSTWQRDGSIVVPEVLSHLEPLQDRIDREFALYQHHSADISGRARMGWARNMVYSLIQQVVRQDPVWYAVTAAGRPDRNWRLITHPYISKDAWADERTGFLHLDLAPARFVDTGVGGSLLTSSVALDEEDCQNCTILVKGFHRHFADWVERLRARGDSASKEQGSFNCQQVYRSEDRRQWGEPVPVPCPRYGLRISRPELIHGSTKVAGHRRRSLFAWHRGIEEDLQTLDLPDALDWNDLAHICHGALQIPSREPQGQIPSPAPPAPNAFSGAVRMTGAAPLSEALVGIRRWDDPMVLHERNILLGPDDEAAHAYVQDSRRRLLRRYEFCWQQLQLIEQAAYGVHSYFGAERSASVESAAHPQDQSSSPVPNQSFAANGNSKPRRRSNRIAEKARM